MSENSVKNLMKDIINEMSDEQIASIIKNIVKSNNADETKGKKKEKKITLDYIYQKWQGVFSKEEFYGMIELYDSFKNFEDFYDKFLNKYSQYQYSYLAVGRDIPDMVLKFHKNSFKDCFEDLKVWFECR